MSTSSYIFECSCGERFNSIQAATTCSKCRTYSFGNTCLYVENRETGVLVWGKYPTHEEALRYEEEMDRQSKELSEQIDAWISEEKGPSEAQVLLENEEARLDSLYRVQDRMMEYNGNA